MALENQHLSRRYKEFICGWSAGCIETCLLYPKTKLIFRQQLHNVIIVDAIKQLKREGMRNLYRGLLPPLIQRTTTRSIMFGTNEKYQRAFGCTEKGPSLCRTLCSFLAGATEACLCPLERIQSILQTSKYLDKFRNTGEAFRYIYEGYSIKEFYRGYSVMILRNGGANIMFFALREPMRVFVLSYFPQQSQTRNRTQKAIANFITGGFLGGCISTIFFPLNVIKSRMQSNIGVDYCSPWKMLRIILAERDGSIRAIYRGVHLNFSRSLFTWGITNSVYEFLMYELFEEQITS